MEEIHQLYKNYGIGGFGFRDDIFTHDMDRARELCDTIRAERLRINWMCETRVDRVDFDLLRRMKRAGCVTVEFGVESGNDDIRRKLRKITTKDQIRQAFRYCHELKIPSMAFFMIGTPWETPQTVEETIAFAKELRATMTIFFLATPFPGTELRKEFLKAGWNIPKNYDAYKHFIEGSGFSMLKDEVQGKDLRSFYSVECRRATKEITLSQVRDVLHYPELLHAYLLRHSFGEFAIKAVQRLKGIF